MTSINKIAVLRDAILPAGAAQTRNIKALKHINKLEDEEAQSLISNIITNQAILKNHLEKELAKEIKKRGNR
ncbi:MAG: hypothetical protein IJ022_07575 [Burkholderiaceae bacterium]|nr:hypothetical protein [Burkholderiaceae bacterium]